MLRPNEIVISYVTSEGVTSDTLSIHKYDPLVGICSNKKFRCIKTCFLKSKQEHIILKCNRKTSNRDIETELNVLKVLNNKKYIVSLINSASVTFSENDFVWNCLLLQRGFDKNLHSVCVDISQRGTISDDSNGCDDNAKIVAWKVRVAIKIVEILEYIHSMGYVYYDLKPANFVFFNCDSSSSITSDCSDSTSGTTGSKCISSFSVQYKELLCLNDFCMKAIDLSGAKVSNQSISIDEVSLTIKFTSPEIAAALSAPITASVEAPLSSIITGKSPIGRVIVTDPSSDLWSLGALLYQLFSKCFKCLTTSIGCCNAQQALCYLSTLHDTDYSITEIISSYTFDTDDNDTTTTAIKNVIISLLQLNRNDRMSVKTVISILKDIQ